MKKFLLYIVFFFLLKTANATGNYGNEWINYDQYYYKIKVPAEGIYRIDYNDLQFSGFLSNYTNINPQYFQIFGREEEQYIYVAGEGDGVFDSDSTTDYIEFYATKNDGWLDSLMYEDPSGMPNPYYSLVNDTIIYYLTVSTTTVGKRMSLETDVNFTGYTASAYFIKEIIKENHGTYHWGEYNSSQKFYQNPYIEGEGWTSSSTGYGGSSTYSLSTENSYASGPKAQTEVVFIGRSQPTTCSDSSSHHIQLTYLNTTWDTLFGKFHLIHIRDSFLTSSISSSTTSYKFQSLTDYCTSSTSNDFVVGYIKLSYPHTYDLSSASTYTMLIPDDANSSKSYVSISNFSASGTALLYDLTNHKRIKVATGSGNYEALVPNSGGLKRCYLTSEGNVQYLTYAKIKPVSTDISHYAKFMDYSSVSGNYVIITHTNLIDEANDYKTYRDQTGYTTIVADINELYGQFGGGVEQHPITINRFANFIYSNWQDSIAYLFLIGKSVRNELCRNSSTNSNSNGNYLSNFSTNLLPTMGYPGSDNLLVAGLNGKKYVPTIAIGRISATSSQEVADYLSKAQEYESSPVDEWMKKVLQFSGGSSISEQNEIKSFTDKYQLILEDTLFGGGVFNFYKNTTEPIVKSNGDSITDLFNEGANIVNLFAHAAGTMLSFGLTNPQDYENDGKYPLIIANSCDAGAIHGKVPSNFQDRSVSEQWTLYPGKGAAIFIATVTSGQKGYLDLFTTQFFEHFSTTMYGDGVGKIMRQTIEDIMDTLDPYTIGVCSDMTLEGDPALNMYAQEKPDLTISEKSIYFNPETVTSDLDSFDINVIATNIGRAFTDTFSIEVIQSFEYGLADPKTYTLTVAGVRYRDTLVFTVPMDRINGVGLNEIQVTLDSNGDIDELNELNNTVTVNLIVKSKDAFPIYPYKYAIIPTDTVTLKASTSNVFANEETYMFQVDTTDSFDSPFLKETTVKQEGGVLNWSLPFTLEDSMVYYWRVGPVSYLNDNNGNGGNIGENIKSGKKYTSDLWRESSFTYINGKRGWSQSHIYQFKDDDYSVMEYNRDQRKFNFMERQRKVEIFNDSQWFTSIDNQKIGVQIDGDYYGDNGVTFDGSCRLYVIDSLTLEFWATSCAGQNPEHNFGQIDRCDPTVMASIGATAKNPPAYAFEFYPSQYDRIYNLAKAVPNGDYVVFLFYEDFTNFTIYPDSILDYFESIGAVNIRNVTPYHPYSFIVKKGYPSTALEAFPPDYDIQFNLSTNIIGSWNYGSITSQEIGPATKWESLHWNEYAQESNSVDSVRLTVYGINDTSGVEEVIPGLESISSDSIQHITNLGTLIDASVYHYIKLKVYMKDDSLYSPALLDHWQVIYDEVPEAALSPALGFSYHADTLQEGEDLNFSIAIENTSEVDMDSLLVSYFVMDKNNKKHTLTYPRLDSLRAGDTIMSSIVFNTIGYTGLNSLWINVNPADSSNEYDQWEQYHFNNMAQKTFYVTADNENPILDVTFDGEHIMDGELVSAKPFISMKLTDENPYLFLDDTALFSVSITTPSDSIQPVYFMQGGEEVMKFTPADSTHNTFTIEYHGDFQEDGVYKLNVHATDASKNASGAFDYQISFEVINKSSITHIINYPNPFSTSTRFVFTLTGSEVPDYFKIQIMTVSGRVVREITTTEIGELRIGNNITEFAWNGTDEFGDPLANGLYLYRVITSINGEDIEHRSEDKLDNYDFFKKGFGKMYLMR